MISKELLSEVLSSNVQDIDYEFMSKSFSESVIRYYANGKDYLINIYELAHECKEWAKKKEYWAISGYDGGYFCMLHDMPDNRFFNASTEIEAIFKATQYIYDNLSNS